MPKMTEAFLKRVLKDGDYSFDERECVFIETGTHRGDTTNLVCSSFNFKLVHSIEISQSYYDDAKRRLSGHSNLQLHLGDSMHVLPKLLAQLDSPLILFLDGHFSHGGTGKGEKPCPLIEELQALRDYKHSCLIIVDDANVFGSQVSTHVVEGWNEISQEKILAALNKDRILDSRDENSGLNRNQGEFAGDDRFVILYGPG
jgi:hypothetical protein